MISGFRSLVLDVRRRLQDRYTEYFLRIAGALLMVFTLLLALHQSGAPVILGRYSARYALALLMLVALSCGLLALSDERIRSRFLLINSAGRTRRQTWRLLLLGWLLLPLSFAILSAILPANDDRALIISSALIGESALLSWWLRRQGVGAHRLGWRWLWRLALGLALLQVILALNFHGRLPNYRLVDELYVMGTAWKQAHDPTQFVNIAPERNARTWANFSMIWPLVGLFMRVFGAGWLQARAFCLLLLWAAAPFIYLAARRLYGRALAPIALLLAVAIPIHHNWSLSHGYVAVAVSIAIYAELRARAAGARRGIWDFALGFFALSAVEGHIYGLVFAALIGLSRLWRAYDEGRSGGESARAHFIAYLGGNAVFLLIWFSYHLALPGISLGEFPAILRETYHWESQVGTNFSIQTIWKSLQLYSFINPYEILILLVVCVLMLWRRRKMEIQLLILFIGSVALIAAILAHINPYYFIFSLPFLCIFTCAALANQRRSKGPGNDDENASLSLMAIYVIVSITLLFSMQIVESARNPDHHSILLEQREAAEIGRAMAELLPPEEVLIVGDSSYYLGMPARLNYWVYFSFTWGEEKYWPLPAPQAIIVTPGMDDGYSGLADWLADHDFQVVACYPIEHARSQARAALLYVESGLMPAADAQGCRDEWLGWLKGKAGA